MTQLQKVETFQTAHFDEKQIDLIKNSICKGATNEELQFFLMACQQTGLDPFAKQIYSVPRGGIRVIQTSVDGYRLIADRTGKYTPGREPTFEYDKHGGLFSATSYIMKQTRDGTWHEVSANAHWSEYNAGSAIWKKMPRLMLAKCAECLALRKAFPAEMSGTYSKEEMDQADYYEADHEPKKPDVKPLYIDNKYENLRDQPPIVTVSMQQAVELNQLLSGCSIDSQNGFNAFLVDNFKIEALEDLPLLNYANIKSRLKASYDKYQKELVEKEMADRPSEI